MGVRVEELLLEQLEEPVPLDEAPREAGLVRKPYAHLYSRARKGIEMFCEHWEALLEGGALDPERLNELRVSINNFNPVIDDLVAAELRELSRRHHEQTGEPLEYGPLTLRRKFGEKASLAPVVERYIGICLKAMRARAQEVGQDPATDADVIRLQEWRKTLDSRAS